MVAAWDRGHKEEGARVWHALEASMIVTDADLPETLAALGLAGVYCSQPEVFDQFEGWLREHGYVTPDQKVSRAVLGASCISLAELLSEVETEMKELRFE